MRKVVLGGGLVGTEISRILSERGDDFVVVTRTRREILPGVFSVALDATDPEDLYGAESSPDAIFNCLNASNYTKWDLEFPPLNTAVLTYALRAQAPLVSVSNLYMYDSSKGPIGIDTTIRVSGKKGLVRQRMWEETQEYISRGLRASEIRASDYISHGEQSPLGDRFTPLLLKGKAPSVIGSVDARHSWTAPIDVARTCIEVVDQMEFGKVWHVPTNPPKTFQEVADDISKFLGVNTVKVKSLSNIAVSAIGIFVPIVREVKETSYQFEHDFVIDDHLTREKLNIQPTDWAGLIKELVDVYR